MEGHMTRVQSGALLLAVGVGLNFVGRFYTDAMNSRTGVGWAGFAFLIMFASVVIGLFGLVRLIMGLVKKD